MGDQTDKINIGDLANPSFSTGDYVRWPIRAIVFSADDKGYVEPIESEYAYGIIIEVAAGTDMNSDAVIIRSTTLNEWIVAHVDDPQYSFELLSRAQAGLSDD